MEDATGQFQQDAIPYSATEEEEASGAQYDQKKGASSSGGTSSMDTMKTNFKSMNEKQQKQFAAEVQAMVAQTGTDQKGTPGGGSTGKTKVPTGPDTITFKGTTYYRAPAPMKFKYVNKQMTGFFERPVKHSEGYITVNMEDATGQFQQDAIPYSATEEADPSVPAQLREKKCEYCGMWGHTKGRCLQKRK